MKNNTILNAILKARNNHYTHTLEVSSSYEIENAIEQVWLEFEDIATIEELKEFFNSMEIYYYEENENGEQVENKEHEEDVYNFDINKSIEENLI